MSGTKSALKKDAGSAEKKKVGPSFGDLKDKDEDKGSKEAKTTKVDKGAFVAALTKSIPAKVMSDIKDWKVDQAAITKTAGSDSGSEAGGAGGARRSSLQKLNRMGTSKIHKFKPAVTVTEAFEWLSQYGAADSNLIFDNQCMLALHKGLFTEFEDLRDGGDDEGGDDGSADKRPADSDDD